MRMRKKPNLIPRMEKCASVLIDNPQEFRSKWLCGTEYKKLYLEIGCGKGRFSVETAKENSDVYYIAVEKVPDAMVIGMERACASELTNIRFIKGDALNLKEMFDDYEVDRIFINFCDPWPGGKKYAKRRLTAPGFLDIYKSILKPGGEIHFKTDNVPLFDYSLESFETSGWELSEVTRDLHKNGVNGVMTDYEAKFYEQGIKINRFVAKLKQNNE